MSHTRRSSYIVRRALVAAIVLQGLSGVAGGIGLVADPSGGAIGISLDWLEGSPFTDYFVPGCVLLTILGVGPLVVAHRLWKARPGASAAALLVGIALLVWIGVEILVVGYQADPPLQLIYGVLGAVIVLLALLPSVRSAP